MSQGMHFGPGMSQPQSIEESEPVESLISNVGKLNFGPRKISLHSSPVTAVSVGESKPVERLVGNAEEVKFGPSKISPHSSPETAVSFGALRDRFQSHMYVH